MRIRFLFLSFLLCFTLIPSAQAQSNYTVHSFPIKPLSASLYTAAPDNAAAYTVPSGQTEHTPWYSLDVFSSVYLSLDPNHYDFTISLKTLDGQTRKLPVRDKHSYSHLSSNKDGQAWGINIPAYFTESTHVKLIIHNQSTRPLSFQKFLLTSIHSTGKKQVSAANDQSFSPNYFIQSRNAWSADDNLRTVSGFKKERENYCKQEPTPPACIPRELTEAQKEARQKKREELEKYKEERKIKETISKQKGSDLYWPIRIPEKVGRIYVHHTAQTIVPDVPAMIRNDYYFHTIIRGWGDIGYNFLIGPDGSIYQGRAGDYSTVGAHVAWHNEGSIGIALLGNYQNDEPSKAALDSLVKLTSFLSDRYNIDPNAQSSFRGVTDYNLLGHRDSGYTQCPGEKLYQKLSAIRKAANGQNMDFTIPQNDNAKKEDHRELTKEEKRFYMYHPELKSPRAVDLDFGEPESFTMRVQNKGQFTWKKDETFAQIAYKEGDDTTQIFGVADINGKDDYHQNQAASARFDLVQDTKPGRSGEFEISLREVYRKGTQTIPFDLVINGHKFEKAIQLTARMDDKNMGYQVVKSTYPKADYLVQGEQYNVEIQIKNTSDITWQSDLIRLVTSRKSNRTADWESGYLKQKSLKPGKVGTFIIPLSIHSHPGYYKQYYNLEYDEGYRFPEEFHYFAYTVAKPELKADFVSQNSYPRLVPGERYVFETTWKNEGETDWTQNNIQLISQDKGFEMNLIKDRVKPGEKGTFRYSYVAPYTSGEYKYNFHFSFFGKTQKSFLYWRVNVQDKGKNLSYHPQDKIRYNATENFLYLPLKIQNHGETVMPVNTRLVNREGLPIYKERLFYDIEPWGEGVYYLKLTTDNPNRFYGEQMYFDLYLHDYRINNDPIIVPVEDAPKIISNKQKARTSPNTNANTQAKQDNNEVASGDPITKKIKVKLGFENTTMAISASTSALLSPQKGRTRDYTGRHTFTYCDNGNICLGDQNLGSFVRLQGKNKDTIWTLHNWNNSPGWNPDLNDNTYRDTLILHAKREDNALYVVNELPLHNYIDGIAEVSNSAHPEKIQTMKILSRTYALHYMNGQEEKFPGKPYHLDDSPARSQAYRGYGIETRAPNIVKANDNTAGLVVSYNEKLVKTPYFNESDGRTRSAKEVWGWTHTPYLQSVDDTMCKAGKMNGHGVGLSGCGASTMAKNGKSFLEIIKHYYTDVKVQDWNNVNI